jgi:uncharacterized radical SAM superfamily Fe-S cluster-containing enzyme
MRLQTVQSSIYSKKYITLLEGETTCPFCHSKATFKIIKKDGKLYLVKNCVSNSEHSYSLLLCDDPRYIKKFMEINFEKTQLPTNKFLFLLNEKLWKVLKIKYHSFLISITQKCNSNCNICYMDNIPHRDISFKKIKECVMKLGKGKNIILFGGEPTVRKDLFKIIKFIRNSGNRAILFTNGLKLSDKKYVKKLKKAGISEVRISFDGFREEIYKILRNDEKQLYKKLLAFKHLKEMKIPTTISFTAVNGINIDQILPVLLFAIKNRDFIRRVTIVPFTPEGRVRINVERVLSPVEILNVIEQYTHGKISKEYYHEFESFKRNITRVLFKLHLTKNSVPSPDILFKIGSLKELIPKKELKKINRRFSEGKYVVGVLKTLKNLLKEKEAFKIFLTYVFNKFKFDFDSISKNILAFYIVPMGSYFYLPGERETVNINFNLPNPPYPIVYAGPPLSVG